MRLSERPAAGLGVSVGDALSDAWRLSRRERDVHEAAELFRPLVSRFQQTLRTLELALETPELADRNDRVSRLFVRDVEDLVRLIRRQKTVPLATRVVQYSVLVRDVEALHGLANVKGDTVGGLDCVLREIGVSTGGEWREGFRLAQRDFEDALRASIDASWDDLERDPTLARETIVLLKHEKARGQWNPLAEKLWQRVKHLAPAEPVQVPEWFIPESDIVYQRRFFDRGGFAVVHYATWEGCNVVVKVIGDGVLQDAELKMFVDEVEIGHKLSHPHVIKIFGACHTSSPPFIVCELAAFGNLSSYLCNPSARVWSLLYQTALGLRFLHKNRIVHGDLKLNNILVTADGKAKVADFGLSRRMLTSKASTLPEGSVAAGAIRWRAPECFEQKPSFESDIYSLGMCIYEALAGKVPYEEVSSSNSVENLIRCGERPELPSGTPQRAVQLYHQMTHLRAQDRIDLNSVVGVLKDLSDQELQHIVEAASRSSLLLDVVTSVQESLSVIEPVQRELRTAEAAIRSLCQGIDANEHREALRWLYRNSSSNTWAELFAWGGVSVLEGIVRNEDAWILDRLYAFDHLDNIHCFVSASDISHILDDLQELLRRSRLDEISPTNALELERIEAVALVADHQLVDSDDIGRFIEDLMRILTSEDSSLVTAAARGIGAIALRWKCHRNGATWRAINQLVSILKDGTQQGKRWATYALNNIACGSADNCSAIVDAGGLVALVDCLRKGSPDEQSSAITTLGCITELSGGHRDAIVNSNGVEPLVSFGLNGPDSSKRWALYTLFRLVDDSQGPCDPLPGVEPLLDILCSPLIENEQAVTGFWVARILGGAGVLVHLLRDGTTQSSNPAANGLTILAAVSPEEVVHADGIEALIGAVKRGSGEVVAHAALALHLLIENSHDHCDQIARSDIIRPLVKSLAVDNGHNNLPVLRLLQDLVEDSPKNCNAVVDAGGVDVLVAVLRTRHNRNVRFAAGLLLQLLRNDESLKPSRQATRSLLNQLRDDRCGGSNVGKLLRHLAQ